MDLTQLEVLLEVVRRGSFAAAARERGVDPSSVSRAVSSLEAELGLRILHRTTRKLALTEAGRRYVDRIEPLVTGLTDAARDARDAERTPSGRVRGTVPVSFALKCICPLLTELRTALPDVSLELDVTDARLDLLDAGLDFAIRLGRVRDADLVARRLFRVHYRCVASPEYLARHGRPTRPAELGEHDALRFPLPEIGAVWRFRTDGDARTDVAVTGPLVLSNTLALRDAARAGLGITVLPDWLVGDDIAAGTLVALCGEQEVTLSTFDASAWLVFPTRRYIPAGVRAVADFLAGRLARP